jgi:hypothetical protein
VLPPNLPALRLSAQRLTGAPFPTASAALRALGAVQSQDYAGAKWALSMRSGATDAELDKLYDAGKILRTHLMRTTWHFVDPADARWMLDLLAPRGRQAMSFMNRKEGLTKEDFARSKKILEKALRDKQYKTRNELAEILKKGGVEPGQGIRLAHLMMDAELEGLVISGPRHGKQFTYGLLEERAPKAKTLPRDEALAEMTRRYFTGHGPAQAADFAWWSGLTLTEVKQGIESVKAELDKIESEGKTYWMGRTMRSPVPRKGAAAPIVHLLPNYDEYFIAYKDRSAIGERIRAATHKPDPKLFFLHILFVNGMIAGGWKREIGKRSAVLEIETVGVLSAAEQTVLKGEAERFRKFAGVEVELRLKG